MISDLLDSPARSMRPTPLLLCRIPAIESAHTGAVSMGTYEQSQMSCCCFAAHLDPRVLEGLEPCVNRLPRAPMQAALLQAASSPVSCPPMQQIKSGSFTVESIEKPLKLEARMSNTSHHSSHLCNALNKKDPMKIFLDPYVVKPLKAVPQLNLVDQRHTKLLYFLRERSGSPETWGEVDGLAIAGPDSPVLQVDNS